MKTNLEKFNYWKEVYNDRLKEFIQSEKISKPEYFYRLYPSGKIETLRVLSVGYSQRATYFCGKIPSRKEIEELKDFCQHTPLARDMIMFRYESVGGKYHVSGALKSLDLDKYKETYFTDKPTAESKAKELVGIRKHEEELLKNGHVRCAYCRKIVPEAEVVVKEIINFKMYGSSGKKNKYCSSQCGHHDQCAHEG